jgi:dGTP triphosphohydrolase
MDNFNLQGYMASGKLHSESKTLTESKVPTSSKENLSEKEDSKKGNENEQKRMEGAIRDDRDHIKNLKKDIEDNEKKLAKLKKDYKKDINESEGEDDREDDELSPEELANKHAGSPMKEESTKLTVSELKAKIKEQILAELEKEDDVNEAEEEVDVDIDVEDEVEVEAGADDIEIERPGVKTTIDVGLSPEEEVVQDSLKAAMDAANALGNQKLADQIGNTITFFTREFVVGQNTD